MTDLDPAAVERAARDLILWTREARGHHGIEECAGPGATATSWDDVQTELARAADRLEGLLAARGPVPASERCGHRAPLNYDRTRHATCSRLIGHEGPHHDGEFGWENRTMPCRSPAPASEERKGERTLRDTQHERDEHAANAALLRDERDEAVARAEEAERQRDEARAFIGLIRRGADFSAFLMSHEPMETESHDPVPVAPREEMLARNARRAREERDQ